jgi:hypothetical protein
MIDEKVKNIKLILMLVIPIPLVLLVEVGELQLRNL